MKSEEQTRREFILGAAKSYLGVSLGAGLGISTTSSLFAQEKKTTGAKAESVIFLNMQGGMSHLDTFDPKPSRKEIQGPVEAIPTNVDGIQISEFLPKTAQIMDNCCVIHSMTSTQGAHEQGQYLLHSSYTPRGTVLHPAMGSWVQRYRGRKNPDIPGYVAIGGSPKASSAGFFGARYSGVPIGNPSDGLKNSTRASSVTEKDFNRRLALSNKLNQDFSHKFPHPTITEYDKLYDEAVRLMKSKDLKAFDLTQESTAMKTSYGSGNFSQGCLLARRLVEHGVRYIEVTYNGWDTHYDNFTKVEEKCAVLDTAYSALVKDLKSKGLLETTLIIIGTEFGRSPQIVPEHQNGRDHHPSCYSFVLAGGGIKGGMIHGATDSKGMRVKANPVEPQNVNATMAHLMGIDGNMVITSPSGRPFTIANKHKAISEILA